MTDPVMLSVASAMASKAAEAAVDGGRTALGALVRVIRKRLAGNQTAGSALDTAIAAPEDPAVIEEFAQLLERIAAADAGFAEQVRGLWPRAQAELSASDGGVVNTSTGTVGGHLVQARDLDLQGGLHLGDVHGPLHS
ncbi:MAG TPA: hypothetical protein VMV92_07090 [Streptosporangiaceae bacterium]|nr:hypothetical protein [Streptosporangiaceae bacterium]